MEIAIARRIELKGGCMIWVPPTGKPFWIEYPNSIRNLTDAEIKKYVESDTCHKPYKQELK